MDFKIKTNCAGKQPAIRGKRNPNPILQDFNMVKIESRPQTIVLNKLKSLFAYMVLLNEIGSENYSGKKILWSVMAVRVRVPPEAQTMKVS